MTPPPRRVYPVWLGLGVGLALGLLRDDIRLGSMAGLVAWALSTAYLRYRQLR